MKEKIIIFTSTFPRWKDDVDPPFVFELAKRLNEQYEVHVLTPHFTNAKVCENIDGLKVYRYRYCLNSLEKLAGGTGILPTLKKNKLFFFLVPLMLIAGLISLVRLRRKTKAKLIHAHWLIPQGFIAILATLLSKTPVVVSVHGADVFALNVSYILWLKRFALKRVERVIAVSNSLKKEIQKISPDNLSIEVLPMGVNSTKFFKNTIVGGCNFSEVPSKLLYVGRMTEKKGVEYLLDAVAILKEKGIKFFLTLVGHGELLTKLESKSSELSLDEEVTFLGGLPNDRLPAIYKSHDIFIGPSITTAGGDTEGFGLTFVEAAMSGCFLIGTDVGGVGDIIKDQATGLLIPEKNSQAIADSIEYILTDSKQYDEIRQKAQKICFESYDWQIIAKKHAHIYDSVINKEG